MNGKITCLTKPLSELQKKKKRKSTKSLFPDTYNTEFIWRTVVLFCQEPINLNVIGYT